MPKDPRGTYTCESYSALAKHRAPIESEIRELNRLILPTHDLESLQALAGFQSDIPSAFRAELHDSTAIEVRSTLVNGLMAHLTPLGAQWFGLAPANSASTSATALHWLHYASQRLLDLLSPSLSNFHTALARSYTMDAAFGTSVLIPRLGKENRIVFDSLPMLTYCLGEDADGTASTLARSYTLSAAQIHEIFQDDTPALIATQAAKPDQKLERHEILHLIEPNPERDPRRTDPKNHPFRAVWVWKEEEQTLREEGFYEQPHAVSTWVPSLTGPYGVSPFADVLPEVRQLQLLALNRAILCERAGNPPWFIPPGYDGKFDPRPHAVNFPAGARGTTDELMPREMPTAGRLDHLQSEADEKIQRIKQAGFYDLFRLLTSHIDQQKTAYEVRELMGEKATLFHPFYARKTQQLTAALRRTLAIGLRAGIIDPPPPELMQRLPNGDFAFLEPSISYNSKLARALELNEANALMSVIEMQLPLAGQEGLASPVFDWLNPAKAGPRLARTYGVPHEVMSTPDEIAAKQQARAQAQQAAMAAQVGDSLTSGIEKLGGLGPAKKALEQLA